MADARRAEPGQEILVAPPFSVNVFSASKGWIVPCVPETGDQRVMGKVEKTMTHKVELAFSLTFDKSHHRAAAAE
jgi:hypothetical protein